MRRFRQANWRWCSLLHVLLLSGNLAAAAEGPKGAPPRSPTESAHPERGSPIPPQSSPQRLETSHAGEGPAWHAPSRSLYFTGGNRISRYDSTGATQVFRQPAGGANGLAFDHQGRLIVCEAANRRVTRAEADGTIMVLADVFEGHRLNSPNDLTLDGRGRIYFTDPRYGSRDGMEMRDSAGQLVEGVYRIDAPGKLTRILDKVVERPNGILVSPDGKHLYVADNNNNTVGGARKLWRFDLNAEGNVSLDSAKLIFDWKTSRGPDGIKADRSNRLYVAAGLNRTHPPFETVDPYRAGIYIFSAEGTLSDFVPIPNDEVTNCAFGDEDLKSLYITAGGTLWRLRLNTRGVVSYSP